MWTLSTFVAVKTFPTSFYQFFFFTVRRQQFLGRFEIYENVSRVIHRDKISFVYIMLCKYTALNDHLKFREKKKLFANIYGKIMES